METGYEETPLPLQVKILVKPLQVHPLMRSLYFILF